MSDSIRGKKYAATDYDWCHFCQCYTPSYRGTKVCAGHQDPRVAKDRI